MTSSLESRWTVPEDWEWTRLSEIGDIVAGGTPSTKVPTYWADEIPWISPADLTGYTAKTIKKGAKSISSTGLENSSAKLMPAGSVHFSSRAPIGYVVISSEALATNQGFKSLVPASGIVADFAYYYLMASREYARQRASGTTSWSYPVRLSETFRYLLLQRHSNTASSPRSRNCSPNWTRASRIWRRRASSSMFTVKLS